jgi:hypothetical protein
VIASALVLAASLPLTTVAERSGDAKTGRYDEVVSLCDGFERAFPGKARCATFGTTPEGRRMLAIVASADGVLDPATARQKQRRSVVLQGGIHAGEIDGKDAGFRAMRDVLRGSQAPGALRAATVVFVPVLNVDGHERVSPWNRSNQRGPEEMGWRATAQNLNLNRDYVKADAPEMRALLAFLLAWDPVLYVDLHATDGAKFRHDISITTEPSEVSRASPLRDAARALRAQVIADLAAKGHLPLAFYPAFVKDDEPESGFAVGVAPPRFSTGYWGVRDRLGLLVETHSWKTYPERVKAAYDTLVAILSRLPGNVPVWQAAQDAARASALELGGTEVPVTYVAGDTRTTLDFLGYAFRRGPSSVSGATRIVYDEAVPEVWRIPLVTDAKSSVAVRAPKAGYLVPAAYAPRVAEKLAIHGIEARVLPELRAGVPVEAFRATSVKLDATSYEGRQRAEAKGSWTRTTRDFPAGSLFVPIRQPGARLAVHLLDPEAPDSLVSWGFLNAVFESKEYVESYVAEEIAERMLAADPAVRAEFEQALASDAAFAASPARRLEFFHHRSPYRDEAKGLVPIFRAEAF